jgi:hypothetical protein
MGKAPADQFYWGDWLNDTDLQSACTVSRGVWINMLCRMWFSSTRGELQGTRESLAKLCNADVTEIVTLENDVKTHDFADWVTDPVTQIVTVRNRRMYRKGKEQKNTLLRVNRLREKKRCNGGSNAPCNGIVTVPSSSSIKEEEERNSVTVDQSPSENHKVPYAEIRTLFIEILPELPRPREENTTWHKECRARWLTYPKAQEEGLEWCRRFFEKIHGIPFYLGENDRSWKPDIGWFWKAKNFWKVIER